MASLAKWLRVRLRTKWFWVRVQLQDSVSFLPVNAVNLHISYRLDTSSRYLNIDFALDNCLFGATKLTKNADPDQYTYSSYGIEFDAHSQSL